MKLQVQTAELIFIEKNHVNCMFRTAPLITHQNPFNSDYFSIYYMLYINCCHSKKAHIIAIMFVALF